MAVTAPPGAPRTVGNYQLIEKIADGSMSSVYRASHRGTGAVVAVKVLAPDLASSDVCLQRLKQEFLAQSAVRHPHLVRALDFGREGATAYLVMEYVEGEDLWQRVERDGPRPEAEAVAIILQVAAALDAAHAQGIIHRDVKPSNILLTADGRAMLTDLGLAKDLEGSGELTRTGRGLGTPNYMAPEQFNDAKHAGILCDVYSTGATLYTTVTGELPFKARGIGGVLRKKFEDDLVPPSQLAPGLSERVDRAIRRAMRANPAERQGSCREFASALTGDDKAASPPGAAPATVRGSRDRPTAMHQPRERRVEVRYPCAVDTRCNRGLSIHPLQAGPQDTWDGAVKDLSVNGIGLVLNRRFEQGTMLTVDLRSPDGSLNRSLEMRVARVRPASRGCWFHGCVFEQPLSKEDLRKLL